MAMNALLIEDDVRTADAVAEGLGRQGFEVVVARDGRQGVRILKDRSFDVIVLDWMLPGRDGIEILKSIRKDGVPTPVLLLTARDAVEDRVLGLESGADDYLIKPFAFAELLARLHALLRRADRGDVPERQAGDLHLHLEGRYARRGAGKIPLTPREFDLLAYLLRHGGQTVSRQMIARDVWHEPHRVTPLDNVIDVHIAHLRQKIDEGHSVKLLHTVRGVGFVIREGPPHA